jgi:hypothetical protein
MVTAMRHALALALLFVVACSSAPAPTRCTPGASVACVCPGIGTGAQVCAADGSSYGACACGVDAGGDTSVTPGADATSGDVVTTDVVQCQPGASEQCTCGSGALGMRACEASARWGGCRCGTPFDAGPAADVVDAAVADVGPNRGTLHQACRVVGTPCADGSECLPALGWDREDSPRGICAYRCTGLPLPPPCVEVTDAGVGQACAVRVNQPGQCLRRCSGSSRCLPSTRCGPVVLNPGEPASSICIPETDP